MRAPLPLGILYLLLLEDIAGAMVSLYRKHPPGLATAYADLENHALSAGAAHAGTPGSLTIRTNAKGARYFVRQYYDHERRKRDQYVGGTPGSPDSQGLEAQWKRRIEEARELQDSVRVLVREGYAALSPKHIAALMPLANHGVFQAGAVLVGTHAFEVIVNRLGIRVAAFTTEDLDVARPGKLALEGIPKGGLLEMLKESGIDFIGVPSLDREAPSTSFKEKGRSRFIFDLLVPASGSQIETRAVPGLAAHATALPYLRYLLGQSQLGAALSTHGVAAVRVPVPERFALHKLLVAQLRTGRSERSMKDLRQASALIAALGEMHPGAIESAFAALPSSSRRPVRTSVNAIRDVLSSHPQSWEELSKAARIA